jgi:hypothetical protein
VGLGYPQVPIYPSRCGYGSNILPAAGYEYEYEYRFASSGMGMSIGKQNPRVSYQFPSLAILVVMLVARS